MRTDQAEMINRAGKKYDKTLNDHRKIPSDGLKNMTIRTQQA